MRDFNHKQFLEAALTRPPYTPDWADTIKTAGATGLAAAAIGVALSLVKSKKDGGGIGWAPAYLGLAGAAAGAAGSLAYQNFLENSSAKYAEKVNDVYKEVYPKIDREYPNKTYTLYFHGMNEGQTKLRDREVVSTDTDEAVAIPGYYAKYLNEWMRNLPSEAKVNVIGHSYGAGVLHNELKDINRKIDNAILVDPINSVITSHIGTAKNKYINNLKIIAPKAMTGVTHGNRNIRHFMGWLIDQSLKAYPGGYRRLRGYDHSMYNSKFRYTKKNNLKELVKHIKEVDAAPNASSSYYFDE